MSRINVHAGDFAEGKGSQFVNRTFLMDSGERGWLGIKWAKYPPDKIESLEVASEEAVKRLGGTVGWGVAGAVILGPVGLLAGLLAGGRGKNVTFIVRFSDGKKALATTDSKTWVKMQAAKF